MEFDTLDATMMGRFPVHGQRAGRAASVTLAVSLSFALVLSNPAAAQLSYDPYASGGQSAAGANGSSSTGGGSTGQASAGQSSGSSTTAATPSDVFTPVTIPNPINPSAEEAPADATRLANPTDGSNPGPLYLRPGSQPGQYELFQRPPPALSEFERFVGETVGRPLPRFGSSLILTRARGFVTPPTTTVPPDYRLNPGDELLIGITGSVEADLHVVIDSEGRIFIPRIGSVNVAGVRYGDLAAALSRHIDEQYKKAKVSVVVSHLHGLNVYVTGYAVSPGAYTVSSLSTMVDAVLDAGGPASGGSFRTIELRRNGQLVTRLDLYDLLLNGDKSHDTILQNNDVINIGPVGPELAITGSVNAEAIYEAKPGETLGDIVRYAGGFDSLADTSRIVISSLSDLDATGSRQLPYDQARVEPALRGDIVRVLSLARVARPLERQSVLVTFEGEIDHPGRYYLPPGATLADLLSKAGGLTSGAYVFGTLVERESIKQQEQVSFDKAIDNLQLTAAALPLSSSVLSGGPSVAAARSQGALAIIERLKQGQKPDGRLVLDLPPDATQLPGQLALENNDRIFVPPQPKTVGVFGAVYQTGSFLYRPSGLIGDYLRLAGGPSRIADRGDVFVVRANGAVVSEREVHDLEKKPAMPGDVVFVPVKASASFLDKLLTATAVVYQFGIGALTLKALGL
jgi:protein involved in polysaccharide export with SLBB domain